MGYSAAMACQGPTATSASSSSNSQQQQQQQQQPATSSSGSSQQQEYQQPEPHVLNEAITVGSARMAPTTEELTSDHKYSRPKPNLARRLIHNRQNSKPPVCYSAAPPCQGPTATSASEHESRRGQRNESRLAMACCSRLGGWGEQPCTASPSRAQDQSPTSQDA